MRRLMSIVAGVALGGLILGVGCGDDEDGGQGQTAAVSPRIIAPEQLLHLTATRNHPLRLRRERDALPGGLAAAMAPMLIDWEASEVGRSDGFVVVRNLNCGGNPLAGTTVLQRVRIPLDGVERIEWTLVPLKGGGGRGQLHHGQLRFVFRADRPAELLDLVPPSGGGDRELHDLVASWEAWREPGVGYDVKAGMDPDAYRLALRLMTTTDYTPQYIHEFGLAEVDRLQGEILAILAAMLVLHRVWRMHATGRTHQAEGRRAGV